MKNKILIGVIMLLAAFWSCDPKDIVLPSWNANLIFPIIDAGFDFNDVTFQEDIQLLSDDDGALTIIYTSRKDTLKLDDLISLPNLQDTFELPPIPNALNDIDTFVTITNSDMGLSDGVGLYIPPFSIPEYTASADVSDSFINATAKSGVIGITIANNFPFDLNAGIEVALVNSSNNEIFFKHLINDKIVSGSTYIMNPFEDVSNRTIEGQFKIIIDGLSTDGGSDLNLDENTGIKLGIEFKDITLKKATLILSPFYSDIVDQLFTFDLPLDAELKSGVLNSAVFKITVLEDTPLPITLRYFAPGILNNGAVLDNNFNIQNRIFELNLGNTVIDFTDDGNIVSNALRLQFQFSSEGSSSPVTIDFENRYNASVEFRDITPHAVFGYLGNYQQTLKEGLGIDFFNRVVSGSISFRNPQIIAFIENELGMSIKMEDNDNLYVSGRNDRLFPGQDVRLKDLLSDIAINAAEFPGDRKPTEIIVSEEKDTRFEEFITLLPDTIDFSFPLTIGTEVPNYNQFVIDTSKVIGGIQLVLPLELKSNNLIITDTIDFDLDVESDYAELINGYLNLSVTNFFHLEFLMQAYVLDSTLNVIDSLFLEKRVVDAGQLNSQGRITTPFKATFSIEVDENKLIKLQEGSFIRPELLLDTSSDDFVKIYDDTKIFLKLNGDFNIHYTQN